MPDFLKAKLSILNCVAVYSIIYENDCTIQQHQRESLLVM